MIPLRILHFIDSGGLYGAEKVILNLSRRMLASPDYRPLVGCIVSRPDEPCELYDEAGRQGIEALRLVIRNGRLAEDLPRVGRRLRRKRVGLVHSHGYKASVFGFLCRPWSGAPVTATCHLWFKGEGQPLKMKAMLVAEKLVYRRYRDVVGVSRPIRDILVASGVPADRIHIIENGVEVGERSSLDPGAAAGLRRSLGLPEGAFLVFHAARLNRQKGQADIVRAAARLRAEGEDVRFLIVGDGPLEGELKTLAQAEGVADVVVFGGFRNDIDDLLQLADVFVLPSLDEGMPMSLLEAVSRRVPVVATAVGDIPLVIEHERSGLIVSRGDAAGLAAAIRRILLDPPHAAMMAEKALEVVRRGYSSEAMFAKYAQIYSRYVGSAAADGGAT